MIRSDRENSVVSALLALAMVVAPLETRAASESDVTLAEALFQDGKKLMAEGKYAEACPKLAESQRLDPGGGTLLALGLCHEGEGKTATAWGELNEALAIAVRDKNDLRAKAAREHIAAIEPKLARIVVRVPAADDVEGFTLALDGAPLAKAAWGTPLPIDPGKHVVRANAPGKTTWTTTIEVAAAKETTIDVSPLADAPATASTTTSPPTSGDSKRTIGFVVGGVSLVALGVGGYFGLRAISKRHQSDDLCPTDNQCTPEGKSLNDEAKSAATVSTVLVGVGIGGAVVATWLLVSAASSDSSAATSSSLHVTPLVGPTGGALSIGGAF